MLSFLASIVSLRVSIERAKMTEQEDQQVQVSIICTSFIPLQEVFAIVIIHIYLFIIYLSIINYELGSPIHDPRSSRKPIDLKLSTLESQKQSSRIS